MAPLFRSWGAGGSASGALRRATESGIPTITTPMRSGSTEQMIEDMRAERV